MTIAAFCLVLVSLLLQARTDQESPAHKSPDDGAAFTVAVLRRDGVVSPFAVFDGKHWSAPWPVDVHSTELPISLGDMPTRWWGKAGPVTEMTAWVDGASRGTIHLQRPTVLPIMCSARLGIVSDYRSEQPPPPSLMPPFPKDGLAVSGTQPVGRIEMLPAGSPEWASTQTFLAAYFDGAEHTAIGAFTNWQDPIPRATRRRVPVEIEAMYRAPMDEPGWVAYYIEAVKRYDPAPEDEGCGLITSANGWMAVAPDGKRHVGLDAHVTYCDRRGVTYMLPLGLLRVQQQSYWAFQLSGYGREGYVVAHPTSKHVQADVRYPAASCAQR